MGITNRIPQQHVPRTRRLVPYDTSHPHNQKANLHLYEFDQDHETHEEQHEQQRNAIAIDSLETYQISSTQNPPPPMTQNSSSTETDTSTTTTSAEGEEQVDELLLDDMDDEIQNTTTTLVGPLDGKVAPIRIKAVLTQDYGLTPQDREYLMTRILHPALQAWSAALHVFPVEGGPLKMDASQLADGTSCGPGVDSGFPSVVVPPEHFTTGILDTDLVLYVSLAFMPNSQQQQEHYHHHHLKPQPSLLTVFPTQYVDGAHAKPAFVFTNEDATKLLNPAFTENASAITQETNITLESANSTNTTTTDNNNINNQTQQHPEEEEKSDCESVRDHLQDLMDKNLTRIKTQVRCPGDEIQPNQPTCNGDYLASSTYCSTDQFDRPVAGMLHICIDDLFFREANRERNIVTMMHEVGHILGFNPQSMAHFRKADGEAITQRDEKGQVPLQDVECTGGEETRSVARVGLPSTDILRFTERQPGMRVANIVTPMVQQVVRNHFDCQSLEGAELETEFSIADYDDANNETEVICIGDHWERRLFRFDLMNPNVDDVPFSLRISPMTLAFFVDSGWYRVNLAQAAYVSGWGRGAGCDFVNENCISEDGVVPHRNDPFFCSEYIPRGKSINEIHGCTADFTRKALCTLSEFDEELPVEYQYFDNTLGPQFGGRDSLLDFCPIYLGFSNGMCKDKRNEAFLKVHDMEVFGESNARCVNSEISGHKTALCVPIACVEEDHTLRIRVDGDWGVCEYGGQRIHSWWDRGNFIVCPDPWRTCPTFFCPRNCLGSNGGICNYTSGTCMCPDSTTTTNKNNPTMFCREKDVVSAFVYEQAFLEEEEVTTILDYYVETPTVLENANRPVSSKIRRYFSGLTFFETLLHIGLALVVVLFCCVVTDLLFFPKRRNVIARKLVDLFCGQRQTPTRQPQAPPPPPRQDQDDGRPPSPRRKGAIRKILQLLFGQLETQQERPPREEEDGPPEQTNKDKFVATLLLELRRNTESGLTDSTSDGASTLTHDDDNHGSLQQPDFSLEWDAETCPATRLAKRRCHPTTTTTTATTTTT